MFQNLAKEIFENICNNYKLIRINVYTIIYMIFQPENMDQHQQQIVNYVKRRTDCAAPDIIRLRPCTVCH